MTVNITINADTLEIYQDGELISIKAKEAEKKDKPESDWIVRRKLKPQKVMTINRIFEGLYFRRETEELRWIPWIYKYGDVLGYSATTEILGPITPDMFL